MQILARTLVPSLLALACCLALTAVFVQVRAAAADVPSLVDLVPQEGRPVGAGQAPAPVDDATVPAGAGTVVGFTVLP